MGFPVPLSSWLTGELADYVHDVLGSRSALGRDLINNAKVLEGLNREPAFGRKIWGLLCLELWQQQFIDQLPEATAATHTTTEEQSS
jgi:asparagine synthase (glutamine-hydrolysing)